MSSSAFILQADPGASYRAQQAEIDAAVARALASGWYILGEEVEAFEREFAAWLGVTHSVGVANGTDAIIVALRALGIGRGSAVATVSHTATATLAAIEAAGAEPVLIDIDDYYTLDASALDAADAAASAKGLRLAAVVPVHIYGQPGDLDAISAFCERKGIPLIEDCAQAHGATWKGVNVGTIGAIGTFSLYPTKNLGGIGDGGVVATNSAAYAQVLKRLRQYGWDQHRISQEPGLNSRLDVVQSAILRVKLKTLTANNARRQAIADAYNKGLAGSGATLPKVRQHATHVYHQYVIEVEDRDRVRAKLSELGIGTAIHYTPPAHTYPAYAGRLAIASGALPRTEAACTRILSLPMYPELTDAQVARVIDGVSGAIS
jgi:dTDP-4-amino-4,6-dideoxygalactose transaminase